jgi:hypothetical protein
VPGVERPTVEHNLRRTIGPVVAIGQKQQVRRTQRIDAAVADKDAGQVRCFVPKDGALVEAALAGGILEDENAIVALGRLIAVGLLPVGRAVTLGNPQPAALVPAHADRLMHIRLPGEQGDVEAIGDRKALGRLLRRRRFVLGVLRVLDAGRQRRIGKSEGGEEEQREKAHGEIIHTVRRQGATFTIRGNSITKARKTKARKEKTANQSSRRRVGFVLSFFVLS